MGARGGSGGQLWHCWGGGVGDGELECVLLREEALLSRLSRIQVEGELLSLPTKALPGDCTRKSHGTSFTRVRNV